MRYPARADAPADCPTCPSPRSPSGPGSSCSTATPTTSWPRSPASRSGGWCPAPSRSRRRRGHPGRRQIRPCIRGVAVGPAAPATGPGWGRPRRLRRGRRLRRLHRGRRGPPGHRGRRGHGPRRRRSARDARAAAECRRTRYGTGGCQRPLARRSPSIRSRTRCAVATALPASPAVGSGRLPGERVSVAHCVRTPSGRLAWRTARRRKSERERVQVVNPGDPPAERRRRGLDRLLRGLLRVEAGNPHDEFRVPGRRPRSLEVLLRHPEPPGDERVARGIALRPPGRARGPRRIRDAHGHRGPSPPPARAGGRSR